jgi:hypothetical protein
LESVKIRLNEEQSRILINIALKDLLPKELEKIKKERTNNEKNSI